MSQHLLILQLASKLWYFFLFWPFLSVIFVFSRLRNKYYKHITSMEEVKNDAKTHRTEKGVENLQPKETNPIPKETYKG